MKAEQLMTRETRACTAEAMLDAAAQQMWDYDCGCLPVVAANGDGRVVGMITDRDVCMAALLQGKRLCEIPVSSAMSHKLVACKPGDDLKTVEELMHEAQVRRIPVLDDNERLQGIISLNDIALEFERELKARTRKQIVQAGEIAETLAAICRRHARESVQPNA